MCGLACAHIRVRLRPAGAHARHASFELPRSASPAPPTSSFSFFAASGSRPAEPGGAASPPLCGQYAVAPPRPPPQAPHPSLAPRPPLPSACIAVPSSPFAIAAAGAAPMAVMPLASGAGSPVPDPTLAGGGGGRALLGARSGDPRAAPPGNAFGVIGARASSDAAYMHDLPPASAPVTAPAHPGAQLGAWPAGGGPTGTGGEAGAGGLWHPVVAAADAAAAGLAQAAAAQPPAAAQAPVPGPALPAALDASAAGFAAGEPAAIALLQPEVLCTS